MAKPDDGLDEVLYEVVRFGMSVRIVAVDPKTGLEAAVVVPATYTDFSMKMAARRKLAYVIRKAKGEA